MPYLWSNPNQQGATPAQLTAGAHINEINMGPVVTAILEHQRQQQQQQAAYQQQIAQGLSTLTKRYEEGQSDDAANRAMYQSQYPGDTTNPGTPGYDDRVPDYGGVQGLRMRSIAENLGGGSPLEQGLLKQKILAEAALAHQRLLNPRGTATEGQDAVAGRAAARGIKEDLSDQFDASPYDFNKVTYGEFDADGNWVPNPSGKSAMVGNQIMTHVPARDGIFGYGAKPAKDVPESYKNVFPRDEVDTAKQAAQRYIELSRSGGQSNSRSTESLPVTEAFAQARAAIAKRPDLKAEIIQRLQDAGYDTANFETD